MALWELRLAALVAALLCMNWAGAEPTTRPATPTKPQQITALKQVDELRSRTDRALDHAALLALARETTSSPPLKYAAATRAMELAAAAADVPVALDAVDELCASFDVDLFNTRLLMLQGLAKSRQPAAAALLAMRWQDEAYAQARLDAADRLVAILRETQGSLPGSLQPAAAAHIEDHVAARRAAGPAAARTTAPLYQCLYQQKWDAHLEALAAGGAPLAALAQEDLAAKDVAARMRAADGWWSHAAGLEGRQAWRIAGRAVQIYADMLLRVDGVERELVLARMAEHHRGTLASQGMLPGVMREIWRSTARTRQSDIAVALDLGGEDASLELPRSNGHVRLRGLLLIETPGRHELIFTGGSAMKITIDGVCHIDDATAYTKRSGIKLPLELAAGLHPFEFEVSAKSSTPRLSVQWLTPGNYTRRAISPGVLFHDGLLRAGQ